MFNFVRSAVLVSGFVLCGCSEESPAKPADPVVDSGPFRPDFCKPSLDGPTEVIVGEGQTRYRDIADNTELFWEKGPQGGHHIWIALMQRGLRMRGTIITIDIEDVEDPSNPRLVNHSRLVYDFARAESGGPYCELPGLRMQLDNAGGVSLESLLGHKVKVVASLKDPDGTTATGTRVVIVKGALD